MLLFAMTDFIRQAGYFGLFAVVLAENLVPPIPSEVVLPFAGWEVARGELLAVPAFLAATAGSVLGALTLYVIAQRGGRRTILATRRVSRVTERDLDRVQERFSRHGVWLVLFGRCVPGLRSVISVPAGMAGMNLGLFLLLTAIGSGIWNAVLMSAGAALGSRFDEVGEIVGPLSTAVVALLAFAVLATLVWLRRRRLPTS